jgi:type II secretory pathway component PulM
MSIKQKFNGFALRIQDGLAGLTDRDRKLLFSLIGGFAIAAVSGGVFWLNSSLANLESGVTYREQTLINAQLIAMEYANNVETAEEIAANLEKHRNTNLSAFLEKSATSVGLQESIDSVKESSGYPLVIQSARFKTRKKSGERVLKLTLAIAAYKPTTPIPGSEG